MATIFRFILTNSLLDLRRYVPQQYSVCFRCHPLLETNGRNLAVFIEKLCSVGDGAYDHRFFPQG